MTASLKMALQTSLYALEHVVTYGKDSCENLLNAIRNIETVVDKLSQIEEEIKNETKNE